MFSYERRGSKPLNPKICMMSTRLLATWDYKKKPSAFGYDPSTNPNSHAMRILFSADQKIQIFHRNQLDTNVITVAKSSLRTGSS